MRLILVLLAFSLISCTRNPVVATVGDLKIYKSDLDYKNTITRIYFPAETRDLGLELLIKSYTFAAVLKNNGHIITDETIQKELERIEKNSLRPEILGRIRGLFGDDVAAYKRVYVLPTYAERVIYYEFFLRDKKIQAASLSAAEDFIKEASHDSKKFSSLAKARGRTTGNFTVTLSDGVQWHPPKDRRGIRAERRLAEASQNPVETQLKQRDKKRVSEEGKRWVSEIIAKLKPGQVYSTVIDMNEHWMVARYLGPKPKEKGTYLFEGVTLPKADYGKWLEAERAKVVVNR